MEDEDIEYLKQCIQIGLTVLWFNDQNGEYHPISSIGSGPQPKDDGDVPEPSEVGWLKNGNGRYIALYGIPKEEILIVTPFMPKWPSEK